MISSLRLTNFLSYRDAELKLGDLVALVGPNASGKSNAVAALKLLRDIPVFGLPAALARRGGFDQLRHRSEGRPYDPAVRLDFRVQADPRISSYELKLGALAGGRYEIKSESASVFAPHGEYSFEHARGKMRVRTVYYRDGDTEERDGIVPVPSNGEDEAEGAVTEGQSALPTIASFYGLHELWYLLRAIQIVEINPSRIRDFQDPSPGGELEPDGSNAGSVFETLPLAKRAEVVDYLSAVVPGIVDIEPRRISNKLTLLFFQEVEGRRRQFYANQMSDGTLRAFGIVLALLQTRQPQLTVIEEPEAAIHLGALRTLVDLLQQHSQEVQVLITTHSADIIDALDVRQLRVVWNEAGASHLAPVAEHTINTLRDGLITPGELLRSDALDPAVR